MVLTSIKETVNGFEGRMEPYGQSNKATIFTADKDGNIVSVSYQNENGEVTPVIRDTRRMGGVPSLYSDLQKDIKEVVQTSNGRDMSYDVRATAEVKAWLTGELENGSLTIAELRDKTNQAQLRYYGVENMCRPMGLDCAPYKTDAEARAAMAFNADDIKQDMNEDIQAKYENLKGHGQFAVADRYIANCYVAKCFDKAVDDVVRDYEISHAICNDDIRKIEPNKEALPER